MMISQVYAASISRTIQHPGNLTQAEVRVGINKFDVQCKLFLRETLEGFHFFLPLLD